MSYEIAKQHVVTQVVNTLARSDGGPARHSLEVNFALNSAGLDVQLISIMGASPDSLLHEMKSREDFPAIAPRELGGNKSALSPKLMRKISASRTLIIHGYYLWWVPVLTVYARSKRVPVVVMPHGALTNYDRRSSRLKKIVFHICGGWLINSLANFVVASSMERDELPISIPRSRVKVVGAGAEFPECIEPRDVDLGQTIRILTLSRIARKKRLDLVLGATRALLDRGLDVELTVAGDGASDYISELKAMTNDLGLRDRTHFVGAVGGEKKSTLLNQSHIFVLPSDDENFGLAFAEAATHAIPAVVSDRVGAASRLPLGAGARLTSPSAETIADAVMRIIGDYPKAAIAMQDYAREEFSWPSVAQRWIDALPSRTIRPSSRTYDPSETASG